MRWCENKIKFLEGQKDRIQLEINNLETDMEKLSLSPSIQEYKESRRRHLLALKGDESMIGTSEWEDEQRRLKWNESIYAEQEKRGGFANCIWVPFTGVLDGKHFFVRSLDDYRNLSDEERAKIQTYSDNRKFSEYKNENGYAEYTEEHLAQMAKDSKTFWEDLKTKYEARLLMGERSVDNFGREIKDDPLSNFENDQIITNETQWEDQWDMLMSKHSRKKLFSRKKLAKKVREIKKHTIRKQIWS